MDEDIPTDKEIADLFHELWGEAIASKSYNKNHWHKLKEMLKLRGINFETSI